MSLVGHEINVKSLFSTFLLFTKSPNTMALTSYFSNKNTLIADNHARGNLQFLISNSTITENNNFLEPVVNMATIISWQ